MSFFDTQLGAIKFYGPATIPLTSSPIGTHMSQYGIGGFVELPNIQTRNEIPINEEMNADGVSSGRRKLGMLVYTIEEGKFFQLIPLSSDGTNKTNVSFTDWNSASDAQKMVWLDPLAIKEDIYGPTPSFALISGTGDPNDCWREIYLGTSPTAGFYLPLSGGTVTGNLTVNGPLTVTGSATYVNSTNLSIEDPLVFLAQNNPANLVDIGMVGQFVNSPTQFTGLVRDHQINEWFLFSGLTGIELTATDINFGDPNLKIDTLRANLVGDLLSGTRVFGDLSASGNVYGNNIHTLQTQLSNLSAGADVLIARIFNADSVPLTRGDVVYTHGAQGDTMSVKLASNLSETTSSRTLGIVRDSIAVNGHGYVTLFGTMDKLHLDVSPWDPSVVFAEGDALWLGSTPGSYTNIKPQAPFHGVYLGVVERANNGNGLAYIKVQNGNELDEIHDVLITSPSPGQILRRDSLSGVWMNVNDAFDWDSVFTTVSSTSSQWDTAYGIVSSAVLQGGNSFGTPMVIGTNDGYGLVLETANVPSMTLLSGGKIGIGTADPNEKLTVSGSISASDYVFKRTKLKHISSSYTFEIEDQGCLILFDFGTETVVTIPEDGTLDFPIGAEINFAMHGTGVVRLSGSPGVALRSADGRDKLRVQHSTATVIKLSANDWLLFGDIWSDALGAP